MSTKAFVGAELAARYKVTSELGSGGMAFVYLALDRHENRQVVVKVPRQAMLDDPEFSGRFQREIKSLVRLPHPHIVKILDVGEHEGKPFLILEYLSGGSLRDRLKSGRQLPDSLKTWLPGIAAALDFCHENDCVHRDVKPDNILFDAQGKAYLSDFGIAKVMSKAPKTKMTVLTNAGMILGTAQYMAPELVMGKKYDGKADQYGLAVTAYEVLAGKTPFTGETPMAVIVEQSTKEAPPLHAIVPGLARQLSGVVARGLRKDPSARYARCADLANAVLSFDAAPEAAITIACPKCGKSMPRPTDRARCPHCQAGVRVKGQANQTAIQAAPSVFATGPMGGGKPGTSKSGVQRNIRKPAWTLRQVVPVGVLALLLLAVPVGWFVVRGRQPQESEFAKGKDESKDKDNKKSDKPDQKTENPPKDQASQKDTTNKDSPNKEQPPVTTAKEVQVKRELFSLSGHTREVYHLAFSPSGSQLASCSRDWTTKVWNAHSGKEIWSVKKPLIDGDGWYKPMFTPDGKRLVGSWCSKAIIWDSSNGEELLNIPGDNVLLHQFVISNNGRLICMHGVGANETKAFDAFSGKLVFGVRGVFSGYRAISPNGQRVVRTKDGTTLVVWDTMTGNEEFALYGHKDAISDVEFTKDCDSLISKDENEFWHVWDIRLRKGKSSFRGQKFNNGWTSTPTGDRILTCEKSESESFVKVWNTTTGQLLQTLPLGPNLWSWQLSPDGTRIITEISTGEPYEKHARIWDIQTGNEVLSFFFNSVSSPVFSADGQRLASHSEKEGEEIRLWDLRTGKLIEVLKGTPITPGYNGCLVFSSDGKRLASYHGRSTIKVWDVVKSSSPTLSVVLSKPKVEMTGDQSVTIDVTIDRKNCVGPIRIGPGEPYLSSNTAKELLTFFSDVIPESSNTGKIKISAKRYKTPGREGATAGVNTNVIAECGEATAQSNLLIIVHGDKGEERRVAFYKVESGRVYFAPFLADGKKGKLTSLPVSETCGVLVGQFKQKREGQMVIVDTARSSILSPAAMKASMYKTQHNGTIAYIDVYDGKLVEAITIGY